MTGLAKTLISSALSALVVAGLLAPSGDAASERDSQPVEGIQYVALIPLESRSIETVVPVDENSDLSAPPAEEKGRAIAVKEIVLPDTVQTSSSAVAAQDSPSEIMVVDNDEFKAAADAAAEITFKEMADSPDKTFIAAGSKFPVYMSSTITSKSAKVGDPVQGRTKVDIKIGGRLVAPKGSVVVGHITKVNPARKMICAELVPNKRWMRMAGSLSFDFDEIVTPEGEHLALVAKPATQARIIKNTNEGRVLGVNHNNEIASPLSTQVKHQALHMAVRAGAACGGVFSMGAVPVAYGLIGAMNPSFAFMQPVGKNMRHRRLKAFALGVITGLPGGFLIADSIIRGPEAIIQPGDIFHAELQQDFTGEASTEAELLPGASTKVHGERIKPEKKQK